MSCLHFSIISLRNILKLAYLCEPNYKRSMGQIVYLLMYVYNNKILFCFLSSCAAYMAQEQMRSGNYANRWQRQQLFGHQLLFNGQALRLQLI